MQRFFIKQEINHNDELEITGEIFHQLKNVLRCQIKDQFILVDNNHKSYLVFVSSVEDHSITVQVVNEVDSHNELPNHVAIACGLSKNDKLEWIVQKTTECGMSEFFPLTLKRDVMQWKADKETKKVSRLQKIAQEAAEQSHRNVVPHIHSTCKLHDLIEISKDFQVKIVAYEETAKIGKHVALKRLLSNLHPEDRILVVFGSEGGLTPQEVVKLEEAGFVTCSLGPRILRAETAPIYFLSATSYHLELKGE